MNLKNFSKVICAVAMLTLISGIAPQVAMADEDSLSFNQEIDGSIVITLSGIFYPGKVSFIRESALISIS
jgi:hypothetical protein